MQNKKHVIVIGSALIFIGLVILFRTELRNCINLQTLQQHAAILHSHVTHHYGMSLTTLSILYVICVSLALPATALLAIAAGFMFGTTIGTLLSVIAATVGAINLFCIARYVLGRPLQRKYHEQLQTFNKELARNGIYYLLAIRFVVFLPFSIANIICALTTIPLHTFAWTTALGIIPASALYAFAGNWLPTIHTLSDILSPTIIAAFLLFALLMVVPIFIKKYLIAEHNS
jgi:uncharacterized membrane protein YdjX (TVP38/TMEM64 family)